MWPHLPSFVVYGIAFCILFAFGVWIIKYHDYIFWHLFIYLSNFVTIIHSMLDSSTDDTHDEKNESTNEKERERDTLWHDPAKGSIMTYIQPDQTGPDHTKPDHTRPDQTIPDRTRPHHTRPDRTRPDQTNPDRTGPDQTRPDQTTRAKEKQQDREKNSKIEGDKEIMTIFCNWCLKVKTLKQPSNCVTYLQSCVFNDHSLSEHMPTIPYIL